MSAPQAYIVEALRTPVGKRNGSLAGVHPADLGAHVIKAVIERTGIDPMVVDDVIFGCVDTIGAQAGNVARTAWLAAGLPLDVPGTTVDRQCGSSQQAIHFAAQAVMSGTQDVVIAGGLQNMSMIPSGGGRRREGARLRRSVLDVHRVGRAIRRRARSASSGGAEMMAEKWDIVARDMEELALESHQRAPAGHRRGPASPRRPCRWADSLPTTARARRPWTRSLAPTLRPRRRSSPPPLPPDL